MVLKKDFTLMTLVDQPRARTRRRTVLRAELGLATLTRLCLGGLRRSDAALTQVWGVFANHAGVCDCGCTGRHGLACPLWLKQSRFNETCTGLPKAAIPCQDLQATVSQNFQDCCCGRNGRSGSSYCGEFSVALGPDAAPSCTTSTLPKRAIHGWAVTAGHHDSSTSAH